MKIAYEFYFSLGIDIDNGQYYENHLSSEEVASILEGDMLVTSVDNVEVWMTLLTKITLNPVQSYTKASKAADAELHRARSPRVPPAAADVPGGSNSPQSPVPATVLAPVPPSSPPSRTRSGNGRANSRGKVIRSHREEGRENAVVAPVPPATARSSSDSSPGPETSTSPRPVHSFRRLTEPAPVENASSHAGEATEHGTAGVDRVGDAGTIGGAGGADTSVEGRAGSSVEEERGGMPREGLSRVVEEVVHPDSEKASVSRKEVGGLGLREQDEDGPRQEEEEEQEYEEEFDE